MKSLKLKIVNTKFMRKIVESKGKIINDREKCIYCGKCQTVCPVSAIKVDRASKQWSIDHNVCVRCKHCVKDCPTNALSLIK